MIDQVVAGDRMDEHDEVAAIDRQPGNHLAEHRRAERELAAPVRVRADRLVVHPAQLELETARGFLAQHACLVDAVGAVVHMGMEALDLRFSRTIHDETLS